MTILTLFISLLPVVIIAFIFYWFVDKPNREQPIYILWAILLGMVVAGISYFLESFLDQQYTLSSDKVGHSLIQSFLQVSLVEEGIKWLLAYFVVFRFKEWNEFTDGPLYLVMMSMGFAAVENVIYGLQADITVALIRALTAVPAHAIFGVMMGFFMSRYKLETPRWYMFMVMSFLLPFLLHGLYDFFIIQNIKEWMMILSIVILMGGLALSIFFVRMARRGDKNQELKVV